MTCILCYICAADYVKGMDDWRTRMPYQILYGAQGPVAFNREYRSLDALATKDKAVYGDTVRSDVYLYDDGCKPWETNGNLKAYKKKLVEALLPLA